MKVGTTNAKVLGRWIHQGVDQIQLLCEDGVNVLMDADSLPESLRKNECLVAITKTILPGKVVYEFAPGKELQDMDLTEQGFRAASYYYLHICPCTRKGINEYPHHICSCE